MVWAFGADPPHFLIALRQDISWLLSPIGLDEEYEEKKEKEWEAEEHLTITTLTVGKKQNIPSCPHALHEEPDTFMALALKQSHSYLELIFNSAHF